MRLTLPLITLILLFTACENFQMPDQNKSVDKNSPASWNDEEAEGPALKNGIKTTSYDNGNTHKEITYKDGKKHGVAREYYDNGKIYKEAHYQDNKLHGKVSFYDRQGNVQKSTEYKGGVKDGNYTTYFKSGKEKSQLNYINNLPQPGLMEVDYKGNNIKQPKIDVRRENLLKSEDKYVLHFSLTSAANAVEYYVFESKSDWNDKAEAHSMYKAKSVGDKKAEFEISVPPNFMYASEIYVYARTKSKGGNDLVLMEKVNVAVENVKI